MEAQSSCCDGESCSGAQHGRATGELLPGRSAHGQATLDGDLDVANENADRIAAIYRELRRRGAESVLLTLLNSRDEGVLAWAAAHALEFAPERGEPVLVFSL
jgi:hypothetical protein